MRRMLTILSYVAIVGFLAWTFVVRVGGPRTSRSRRVEIVSELEKLEGAKDQYALDHHLTANIVPTREQLLPYLLHEKFPEEKGVEYRIQGIHELTSARLTKACDKLPRGTIIRLSTNGYGWEIIPPDITPH